MSHPYRKHNKSLHLSKSFNFSQQYLPIFSLEILEILIRISLNDLIFFDAIVNVIVLNTVSSFQLLVHKNKLTFEYKLCYQRPS